MTSRVLVVGAKPDSLGSHLVASFKGYGYETVTAGIHDEDIFIDLVEPKSIRGLVEYAPYMHVVYTAGVNYGYDRYSQDTVDDWMNHHMQVNVYGAMNMLKMWMHHLRDRTGPPNHFVAVSSNSAHIARQNSMAYCASKAALSMSIRVAAREVAKGGQEAIIYGYEPGLLIGTPMTKATEERFGPSATRIPGSPHGLHADDLAAQIAATVHVGGRGLNGTLLRVDGGEQ